MRRIFPLAFALFLFPGIVPMLEAAERPAPKVLVSIKPLHSLAAAVMEGVAVPGLIVTGTGSEHTFALRPTDARRIQDADLVFWMGAEMEGFLEKPLAALTASGGAHAMIEAPGLKILRAREGGPWEADDHGHGREHDKAGKAEDNERDLHVWLDIDNARRMAAAMAVALSTKDPDRASRYAANLQALEARLDALDREIKERLAPIAGRSFVVFHDAYQYFEARYALPAAGAIMVDPEHPPGAKRLAALRAKIKAADAICVFAEPQYPSKLVATVTQGTRARPGTLDPIGADLADGPGLYPALMRNLAKSLLDCLGSD